MQQKIPLINKIVEENINYQSFGLLRTQMRINREMKIK